MKDAIKKGILEGLGNIEEASEFQVIDIEVEKIKPNIKNFYRIDGTDIERLASDIKENGLYHNLLVRALENGEYQIISGERRYSAIKTLGWEKVSCKVINADEVDSEIILIQANARTRELNESEKLKQVERLEELYKQKKLKGNKVPGRTRDLIGEDLGMSGKQVGRYQKINKDLIPELRELIETEKLTITNAMEFANLSEEGQKEILNVLKQKSEIINLTKVESQNLRKTIEEKEKQFQVKEQEFKKQAEEYLETNNNLKEQLINYKKEIEDLDIKIKHKDKLEDELRETIEKEIESKNEEEILKITQKVKEIEEEKKKLELEKLEIENKHKNLKNDFKDNFISEEQLEGIKINAEISVIMENLNKATIKATNAIILSKKNNIEINKKNNGLIQNYQGYLEQLQNIIKDCTVSNETENN